MMNECREVLLELFNNRFTKLEKSELTWISFLDPRVARRTPNLSPADIPRACDNVVRAAVELADEERNTPFRSSDTGHQYTPVSVVNIAESFNLSDCMFGPDDVEIQPSSLDQACNEELKLYLADVEKSVVTKTDPFEWWRVHKNVYPNLRRLARKWLGTEATSVPSERAFSTSGYVVTVKRSSLTPAMVRDLVFVSENWRRHHEQNTF
ncbi:hypothetical protein PI124_g17207 [Phytophthora idaei]|nr:hypothetical protein PI124_g17207 [Phytophthora idaei]